MKLTKLMGLGAALFTLAIPVAVTASEAAGEMAGEVAGEVNVYSYRQPNLVQPLFDGFTAKTGIKVNTVFAKKGMAERLAAEGANSPADVILTVDIGRLMDVTDRGLVQPVASDVLSDAIPANLRDADGQWFGLTTRARVMFVSKDRVADGAITDYEQLADPQWKGRICTRSGAHAYNVALIASLVAHWGEAKTMTWLKAVKENLARKPQGNDRAQVKAVAAGECDIAIGNTYYMGKMINNPDQKAWADAVRVVFPNSDNRGTHVNVSGMAMAKHAPHKDAARALMEYLVSDEAQALYAEQNYEYPVKAGVAWSDLVKSWGTFKGDELSLSKIADYRKKAIVLVHLTGFDN